MTNHDVDVCDDHEQQCDSNNSGSSSPQRESSPVRNSHDSLDRPNGNSPAGGHKFVVREARVEDCEQICEMVHELAAHEGAPEQVVVTVDQLREDGFGTGHHPRFYSFVVERVADGGLIGFTVFVEKYSTWKGPFLWAEDIYVRAQYRHCGIGEALLRKLSKYAQARSMNRIEWCASQKNVIANKFYKKQGAFDLTERELWHTFRFTDDKYEHLLDRPYKQRDQVKV